MNRLKKKAWGDFRRIFIVMILLLLGFGLIVFLGIEGGIKHLFGSLAGLSIVVGLPLYAKLRAKEKDVQNYLEFDEREFYLYQKSLGWGNYCFMAYVSTAMGIACILVGWRGMVPMWSMLLMLISGAFLSEAVRFLVLMHHAKEDDKNIEGGDA